jgi:hypothetical protein
MKHLLSDEELRLTGKDREVDIHCLFETASNIDYCLNKMTKFSTHMIVVSDSSICEGVGSVDIVHRVNIRSPTLSRRERVFLAQDAFVTQFYKFGVYFLNNKELDHRLCEASLGLPQGAESS